MVSRLWPASWLLLLFVRSRQEHSRNSNAAAFRLSLCRRALFGSRVLFLGTCRSRKQMRGGEHTEHLCVGKAQAAPPNTYAGNTLRLHGATGGATPRYVRVRLQRVATRGLLLCERVGVERSACWHRRLRCCWLGRCCGRRLAHVPRVGALAVPCSPADDVALVGAPAALALPWLGYCPFAVVHCACR